MKVSVHYPGRPFVLFKGQKESAEPILAKETNGEGVNLELSVRHRSCNMEVETEHQFEITGTHTGGIVRKTGGMV